MKLSEEKKLKIKNEFMNKLNKSFDIDLRDSEVPFYKALFLLMDNFNTGSFYGSMNIKMNGPEIKYIKYDNVSVKLDIDYNF